jgi:hypothetical protein
MPYNYIFKRVQLGPTMLLGATHAPLDHYFIFRIFLESF